MNVKELCEKGKEETVLYKCGNCNTYYTDKTIAENCCKPVCCSICGKEISQDKTKCWENVYYVKEKPTCRQCWEKSKLKTVSIQEWLNTCDCDVVCVNGEIYDSIEDAISYLWSDGLSKEEIKQQQFFVCEKQYIDKINIEDVLYNLEEKLGLEDVNTDTVWKDRQELKDFIDKWNAKQDYYCYHVTNTVLEIPGELVEENIG